MPPVTRNLQACGGCDLKLAGQLGADLEITGMVQKVSNLIINLNIYLRDVKTGNMITVASADMRGNTDEIVVAHDELSDPQSIAGAELREAGVGFLSASSLPLALRGEGGFATANAEVRGSLRESNCCCLNADEIPSLRRLAPPKNSREGRRRDEPHPFNLSACQCR